MLDANAIMHGYVHEAIAAVVLSIGGWILVFPVRTFFNAIKNAWNAQADTLKEIAASTDKQTELLKDAVKILGDMHLDQRSLMGKLGSHE